MSETFQVQCRGLPWEATEEDLRGFFGGNGIESVDIPKRNGRTSGDATVTFSNEDDYKLALKKDREHLGSRYIEVFPMNSAPRRRGDRDDFRPRGGGPPRDRYSDRGEQHRSGGTGGPDPIIRLRGLPFSVTARDINDFLQPLGIVRDGILLPDQQRARPSGEAYIVFDMLESVQIAKQRHMKNIGHRYIEVFEATHRELQRFADDNGLRVPRMGPSPFISSPPTAGPPRGAYDPYSSTDRYRTHSGGDYRRSEPEDPYGRPRPAPAASDYGSRVGYDPYQQTAPSSYPAQQPASGFYDNYSSNPTGYETYGRERVPDPRDIGRDSIRDSRLSDSRLGDSRPPVDPYPVESRYPDYGYDSRDSRDSYWRGGGASEPRHGSGGVPPAPASRDPYSVGDSWASGGGADRGRDLASDRSLDRYGSGGYTSEPYAQREAGGALRRSEYGRPDDRYSRPDPYGGHGRERERDYGSHSTMAPSQSQHFVLRMRGVPFRATEEDVYDFFRPIRPNKVELIRDNQFRASGDARVIFFSRKDYDEALMKDKQYMGERYIEMIPDNGRY
ncbi:hypothetical protein GCK72_001053 [Caenorhabditis remanei]|uniref:RRM domain-containing protein n=1 Tax=Caenorhabditis remanei TaxID=31234 RepID=A0A6A5HMV8_CAERE|nr:hypothetical protein GCK72_001053 [Caenorhabditis remanei]KAF1769238.1 hypothetical protein GCK72_001053 [Caenorhabditis remanei]